MSTETDTKSESSVEVIKRSSNYLRGDLANDLGDGAPSVSGDSEQLLKFHGIYSQDNRDERRARSLAGEELDYIFMIRVVVPGGRLSCDQWLSMDDIATTLADGSLRLTTRQAVQFHGVVKGDLRDLAQSLDRQFLSTFGACGDVVRNVVTCPRLHLENCHGHLEGIAHQLRQSFRSTSEAHWEIFINGERAASREEVEERPFYGDTYLPRKFKIAVSHPRDNCVDVFAQDVGLIPTEHEELGAGFTLLVGGGLGRSYANDDTFARLAEPLTFVTNSEVEEVIAAVIATYRDLGNRSDRKRARLKYVVADLGLDAFRGEVEVRLGRTLRPPLALPAGFDADDHLGWRPLPDGSWQVGLRVGAGRVRDIEGGASLRSALRQIATRFGVTFFITPQQDLIVSGIVGDDRDAITQLLVAHHVRLDAELGTVERHALACPALPTCGQALTEAERRLPELVSGLEEALARRSLGRRSLQLRMTGCPNGCARPALAEIGVVGRTKSTYDLLLGGGTRGNRLASVYREKVKLEDIPDILGPLFDRWALEADVDETFGDFVTRVGAA
ncbi:MAG: NADPH-dependent assimilatory sulfite reductase hemoprotein subunit [Acidimicrobiales bacterium]